MYSRWWFTCMLTIIYCFTCAGVAKKLYSLGVNFGTNEISAAIIQENGEALPVASITTNKRYRENIAKGSFRIHNHIWYEEEESLFSLYHRHRYEVSPEDKAIISSDLTKLRNASMNALGGDVRFSSIALTPLAHENLLSPIKQVVFEFNNDTEGPEVLPFNRAGLVAYDFHLCKAPGIESIVFDPRICKHRNEKRVIFVQYDNESLSVADRTRTWATTRTWTTTDMINNITTHCDSGGWHLLGRRQVNFRHLGAQRLYQEDQNQEQYSRDLQEVFSQFATGVRYFTDYVDEFNIDDIWGFVLAGEAPKSAFSVLRDAIVEVFPDHEHLIRDSIDPAFVGAVGAARWNTKESEKPPFCKVIRQPNIYFE